MKPILKTLNIKINVQKILNSVPIMTYDLCFDRRNFNYKIVIIFNLSWIYNSWNILSNLSHFIIWIKYGDLFKIRQVVKALYTNLEAPGIKVKSCLVEENTVSSWPSRGYVLCISPWILLNADLRLVLVPSSLILDASIWHVGSGSTCVPYPNLMYTCPKNC